MDTKVDRGGWVLVADGEKALLLENRGGKARPDFRVLREMENDNPPTREQGSDAPGRFNDGPSPHRSAVEQTDWHWLAKERFAREAADLLYRYAHAGRFRELVLVAAPAILGELRKELHPEVGRRVVAEVPKTLTNHPVSEIERLLNG